MGTLTQGRGLLGDFLIGGGVGQMAPQNTSSGHGLCSTPVSALSKADAYAPALFMHSLYISDAKIKGHAE